MNNNPILFQTFINSWPGTIRGIACDINKLAFFLTTRTLFRWIFCFKTVTAFLAFPYCGHNYLLKFMVV